MACGQRSSHCQRRLDDASTYLSPYGQSDHRMDHRGVSAEILSGIMPRHDHARSPPLSSRAKVERGADQKNHRIDDLQNSGAHQVYLRLRLEHAPEGPDQGGRESDEYEEAQAAGEDQGQQRDEEK